MAEYTCCSSVAFERPNENSSTFTCTCVGAVRGPLMCWCCAWVPVPQVLHVHYDDLSSFLVRHTEVELERQAQAASRRRMMDWEQVGGAAHVPAHTLAVARWGWQPAP
jgi:hypothetical protein